jgi:hypothetical protein
VEVLGLNSHYRDALRLRYWDDIAKVPGLQVPGLDHYRLRLEAAVRDLHFYYPEPLSKPCLAEKTVA